MSDFPGETRLERAMRLLVFLAADGSRVALRPERLPFVGWEVYDSGDYEDIIISVGPTPEAAIELAYEKRTLGKLTYEI